MGSYRSGRYVGDGVGDWVGWKSNGIVRGWLDVPQLLVYLDECMDLHENVDGLVLSALELTAVV